MIIEIDNPQECPCYDHDGFCEAIPNLNQSCGGGCIPDSCPAKDGLVIITKRNGE